jgi:hypothetical protein
MIAYGFDRTGGLKRKMRGEKAFYQCKQDGERFSRNRKSVEWKHILKLQKTGYRREWRNLMSETLQGFNCANHGDY